jgi:prepilin-type N-terminal cleavage/methylation domain-containing protein
MNARGFTLMELVVVLALMGILAGVASLSAAGSTPLRQRSPSSFEAARDSAIADGRPRTEIVADTGGSFGHITFLPDGRVVTDAHSLPGSASAPR